MKALVIIDMQNDFISGSLGTPEAEAIVPNVIKKISEYKDNDTLLLFTKDTHHEDYLSTQEGINLPVPHCIENSSGWSIDKRISGYVKSISHNLFLYSSKKVVNSRIIKETFGSTTLAEIIKDNQDRIDEVILVGLCTDICVISNALLIKAYVPEMKITVDASCCAGVTPESHKNALNAMKMCQINIINEEN